MKVLQRLGEAAADLLVGRQCCACDRPGPAICSPCRAALVADVRPVWRAPPVGGRPVAIWTAMPYSGTVAALIASHKDHDAAELTGTLADLLAASVQALLAVWGDPLTAAPILVPIPTDRGAIRQRGFDHAGTLATVTAQRLGLRAGPLLRRAGLIEDQGHAAATVRWQQQSGTMVARCCDRPVVLVDDVVTTGATVLEGRRALQAAGVAVLGVATVAETQRRFPA